MAIRLCVLGSGKKLVQIGNNLVELPLTAGQTCLEFLRDIDLIKIFVEPIEVRCKMSSRVRARLEIVGKLLRGRQRHTISNPINVEPIGQKIDDRVTCKKLGQDMMNRKHATVTFWRTPASELIVSSAGNFDWKYLVGWPAMRGGF